LLSFKPTPVPFGTAPPAVTVTENRFLNLPLRIEVTLAGILGVALFRFSTNYGASFTSGLATGAGVSLPGLPGSISVTFAAGLASTDNVYIGAI
jgi:hypothetical protein